MGFRVWGVLFWAVFRIVGSLFDWLDLGRRASD